MLKGFQGQICVYCQQRQSTKTGDHVIASGFMPETRWTDENPPIRVPACIECQQEFHRAEQYFMTLLPLDMNSAHPAAMKVAQGQVSRSLEKAPWIWKPVRDSAQPIDIITPSGVFMGQSVQLTPREDWYEIVLIKITKGLFYYHMHEPFPIHYDIGVGFVESLDIAKKMWSDLQQMAYNGPFQVGNQVFEYAYLYSDVDAAKTTWLMSFYHGHFFHIVTAPPRKPGDVLLFPSKGQMIRRVLLDRNKDEAILRDVGEDTTGKLFPGPNVIKLKRSALLAAFPVVDRIDLDEFDLSQLY
jgi:hypothetical protein